MRIDIEVNPGNALPLATSIEGAYAKVEARGVSVGAALSKGLAETASAADKARAAAQSLGGQFDKMKNPIGNALADQLKREAEMFNKIHGPAREYEADLKALDMLLQKSSITVEQYAEQVTKMNRAIEGVRETTEEAASPAEKLSTIFEMFAAPAAAAGFLELGHKVEEFMHEAEELSDKLTELENKAQKFIDATHDTATVIAEQRTLANQLHGTLDPTIEIYDAIRDGTDELRISHKEQIRLTQTLGEQLQLANKPLEAAGGLMQRFSYAMAAGKIETRELKGMMREVPELADAWTKHFNTTRLGLLNLVATGKVSVNDLMRAEIDEGAAVDKLWERRKRTYAEERAARQELAQDRAARYGMSGSQLYQTNDQIYDAAVNGGGTMFSRANNGANVDAFVNDQRTAKWKAFNQIFLDQIEDAKNLTGKWHDLGDAADKALGKMAAGFEKLPEKFGQLQASLTSAIDKLLEAAHSNGARGIVDEIEKFIDPWHVAANAIQHHAAVLTDDQKVLEKINAAQEEQSKGIASIGRLYGSGLITIKQYNAELERLMGLWHEYELEIPSFTGGQLGGQGTGGLGQVANFGPLPAGEYGKQFQANRDYRTNADAGAYKEWEARATDAISGIDRALKKLMENTLDVGRTIQESIAGAFDKMNQSLVNLVTTGKADFGEFATYIEQQLMKIALQEVEMGLIKGAALAVAGSAHGSDTVIPHAATGYSARIGGVGGTDSKLFMSWVTPGETVSIRTPEQNNAAARKGRDGLSVKIDNHHDTRGELASSITSGAFDVHVLNVMKRNRQALQSILKK